MRSKKNTKIVAILLVILLILGSLPLAAMAAGVPDSGKVFFRTDSGDANNHFRQYYIGQNPLTPYFYNATGSPTDAAWPFYCISGMPGDLNVQTAAKSNWAAVQASQWPIQIAGSIQYNYGGNGNTGPAQVLSTTITLEQAQKAFALIMYNGFPFDRKTGAAAPYSLSATEMQYCTNMAIQRLMGLFILGHEYSTTLPPYTGLSAAQQTDVKNRLVPYVWYLEQKAREFLKTKDNAAKLKISPAAADMAQEPNDGAGFFKKQVRISLPTDNLSADGFLNVFTLKNVDFPTGTEIWDGSTKLSWSTQYPLAANTHDKLLVFKVPLTTANSGKTFHYTAHTRTIYDSTNIDVYYSDQGTKQFGLVADESLFGNSDQTKYKISESTEGELSTGAMGNLIVHKTGTGDDSGGLAGARIGLYQSDGSTFIGEQTTPASGKITWSDLAAGTYKVKELEAPDGYTLNPTMYSVKVVAGSTVTKVIANNGVQIYIDVLTTGEDADAAGLAGCKVGLYDEDGSALIEEKTVDGSGKTTFGPIGVQDYIVKETFVPNPYVLGTNGTHKETERLVVGDYQTPRYSVSIANKKAKGYVTIERQDSETGVNPQGDATLNGARYDMFTGGTKVATVTTLPTSRKVQTGNYPLGTYTINETYTPTGYLAPSPNSPAVTANISYMNMYTPITRVDVIVKSPVIKGTISVGKFASKDTSGTFPDGIKKPLPGVQFTATLKSSNALYETITTDLDGKAKTQLLPYGTYVVTETVGVDGFEKVQPFDVFVTQNGFDYWHYVEDATVERLIRVIKTDQETDKTIPLAGTQFQILDSGKTVVGFDMTYPQPTTLTTLETDTSGTAHLPNKLMFGTYYLREILAPSGYLLNNQDIQFDILSDSSQPQVIDVKLPNKPAMGTITIGKTEEGSTKGGKTGQEWTGMGGTQDSPEPTYKEIPLPGVVFEVIATDNIVTGDGTVRAQMGEVVDTITTDANGYAQTKQLYLGSYKVVEKSVPDGYILDLTEHPVVLEYKDQLTPVVDVELQIANILQKVDIAFTKTAETMAPDDILFSFNETPGFKFGVYADETVTKGSATLASKDQLIAVATSGEHGLVSFTGLPDIKMYVKEISSPNPAYAVSDTKYPVVKMPVVPEDTQIQGYINNGKAIQNFLKKKQIDILNHLKGNEEVVIEGGEFDLINKVTNKVIYKGVTDLKGKIEIPNVPIGEYIVKQTKAADGYLLNEADFPVNVTEGQSVFLVKVPNEKTSPKLVVTKTVDKPTAKVGENVTWTITVKNEGAASAMDVVIADARLKGFSPFDAEGKYTLLKLDKGETKTFTVAEKVVAEARSTIHNVVLVDGKAPDGTPLPQEKGEAEYKVTDGDPNGLSITKTVDKPTAKVGETVTWTITVKNNGKTAAKEVVITDARLKGIAPFDANGVYAMGALAAGESKTITASEKVTAGAGTTVKNIAVVTGKDPDGKPLPEKTGEAAYTVVTPGDVVLTKVSTVDKTKRVAGATIKVYQGSTIIKEAVTDENGLINLGKLAPGNYNWTETKAPAGYVLTDKVLQFTVDASGNVTGDIVMENKPYTLTIIDHELGNESILLPDGEFIITDSNGRQVGSGKTDGTGKLVIVGLVDGIYTIKQIKAPTTYIINNTTYNITIGNNGNGDFVVKVPNTKDPNASASPAPSASAANNGTKTGSGAQTGQDGLPFWLLAVAIAAIAGAAILIVVYRKKTAKYRR